MMRFHHGLTSSPMDLLCSPSVIFCIVIGYKVLMMEVVYSQTSALPRTSNRIISKIIYRLGRFVKTDFCFYLGSIKLIRTLLLCEYPIVAFVVL